MSWVKAMPLRAQLAFIGFGYAAVMAYAVMMEFMRYQAAMRDPVSSSGGMWAFGDELLAWNIFVFFMVPTFLLLLVMRQYDEAYIKYSKILFWTSLTAPLVLAAMALGNALGWNRFLDSLLWRSWRAPFVLGLLAMSRMCARADVAKRLLTRAVLIEGGTIAICLSLIVFSGR